MAIKSAGSELKQAWRQQITSAGLGHRLPRTIRNWTYPKGQDSIDAAVFVWSNAPEILNAHDKGVLIRSKNGFYLAIPTEAAGKGRGGARLTPGKWEQRRGRRLRFIYRRNAPSLLVAEKARINKRGTAVPKDKKIHVILDNYATHKHPNTRAWLARHPRWTFHFIPTSSSWLNAVEGFFATLTRRRLKYGVFKSVDELKTAIDRFIAKHNKTEAKAFVWKADPDKIIAARNRGFQVLDSIH